MSFGDKRSLQPTSAESPAAAIEEPTAGQTSRRSRLALMREHRASRDLLAESEAASGESTPQEPTPPKLPTAGQTSRHSRLASFRDQQARRDLLSEKPVRARAGSEEASQAGTVSLDGMAPAPRLTRKTSSVGTDSLDESLLAAQRRHAAGADVTSAVEALRQAAAAVNGEPGGETGLTPALLALMNVANNLQRALAASAAAKLIASPAPAFGAAQAAAAAATADSDSLLGSGVLPASVGQARRASLVGVAEKPKPAPLARYATAGAQEPKPGMVPSMGLRQDSALVTEAGAVAMMRMDSETSTGRPASPPLVTFGDVTAGATGLMPGGHSPVPSEASTLPAQGATATVAAPNVMMPPPPPAAAEEEPDATQPQT